MHAMHARGKRVSLATRITIHHTLSTRHALSQLAQLGARSDLISKTRASWRPAGTPNASWPPTGRQLDQLTAS